MPNISELDMKRGGPEIEEERDSGLATDETDEEREVKGEAELDYKMEIVWSNIVKFIILHLMALYSLTLLAEMSPYSWLWLVATYLFSGAGITAGAHRLWSHRTYKAKLPLRSVVIKRSTTDLYLSVQTLLTAGEQHGGGELRVHLVPGPQDPPQVLGD